MKITKTQLKKIIKEELEATLKEYDMGAGITKLLKDQEFKWADEENAKQLGRTNIIRPPKAEGYMNVKETGLPLKLTLAVAAWVFNVPKDVLDTLVSDDFEDFELEDKQKELQQAGIHKIWPQIHTAVNYLLLYVSGVTDILDMYTSEESLKPRHDYAALHSGLKTGADELQKHADPIINRDFSLKASKIEKKLRAASR